MNDSQLKNKEKLAMFASQLRKLSFPSSQITIELAEFASSAIESYLGNKEKSLDSAFGLTPKRGGS